MQLTRLSSPIHTGSATTMVLLCAMEEEEEKNKKHQQLKEIQQSEKNKYSIISFQPLSVNNHSTTESEKILVSVLPTVVSQPKPTAQPEFGMTWYTWFKNAAGGDIFTRIVKAAEDSFANDPSLNKLHEKNSDFRYALDKVKLAGKMKPKNPEAAKKHLDESLTYFHRVAETPSSKLHPLHKAEASSYAMEIARQLGKPKTEVNHYVDRTQELVNEVAKNVNNNDWLHETEEALAPIWYVVGLFTHGVGFGVGGGAAAAAARDKKRKEHELKEIKSLNAHIKNVRAHLSPSNDPYAPSYDESWRDD
jgi:hypothetical protein